MHHRAVLVGVAHAAHAHDLVGRVRLLGDVVVDVRGHLRRAAGAAADVLGHHRRLLPIRAPATSASSASAGSTQL